MTRKYHLRFDETDLRDKVYRATVQSPAHLPSSVDLRPKMPPVVDQGQLGSCTANAIGSGLREYQLLQAGNYTQLSRLYLYWHERALEGTIGEDSGAMIRDGFKVLQQNGIAPEKDFPYDISTFTHTPLSQAEQDAAAFKISEYHRITTLDGVKAALAEGLPVVIGMSVYESFESEKVAATGIVPIPRKSEQNLGGHAVLIVGYDNRKKKFIVRNSWGTGWGDKGYCYIPFSFISRGIIVDMWTGK
jgi:C1A family cysteine protease